MRRTEWYDSHTRDFGISNAFPCITASSSYELCCKQFGNAHPFAPRPLQPLHHYYECVRPCNPMRANCRFTSSSYRPVPDSCRLNAGCHVDNKQVISTLLRGRLYNLLLTPPKISTLHQSVHFRSTFWTTHDGSISAFSQSAHHHGH